MSHETFHEEDYNKRFDFKLWQRVLQFVKPYRRLVIALIVVMVPLGIIESTGPLMTLYAVDHFIVPRRTEGMEYFAVAFIILSVLLGIHVWLLVYLGGKISRWVCYDIRNAGFKHLQGLSFSYFDRTPVGWLMTRLGSDTERLGEIVAWGLADVIWGGTVMIVITSIMLYLNWRLALIVFSVIPILVWISGKFQRLILSSYREVRKTNSRITASFNENTMGVKTTKSLVREHANLGEFESLTGTMFSASVIAAVRASLYLPLVMILGAIGAGLAVWFGGSGIVMGSITYGTLVAFITYTTRFFEPVQEVARIFAEMQNAQAAAERIFTMLSTEPEIKDMPPDTKAISVMSHHMKGRVEFHNVTFTYSSGEKVLEDFNLTVEPGQIIALVGETGSGKSTIVNLACRFYEPTGGEILIDGVDYRRLGQHWLQSNLGVVLQTPHLFKGTIIENIRYGRLNATDDEVTEAAKLVHAHEFIIGMENGYHGQVGEGGTNLSTGQKQLVSFARAILANPGLFIMDEATSSVDTQTEQLIQRAIEKVLCGRTSFIIAHRLSTIRMADRILVIDKGKIIEEGHHRDLLRLHGWYYQLYTNQFKQESIA